MGVFGTDVTRNHPCQQEPGTVNCQSGLVILIMYACFFFLSPRSCLKTFCLVKSQVPFQNQGTQREIAIVAITINSATLPFKSSRTPS